MTVTDHADIWVVGDENGGHVVWSFDEARKAYDQGWTVIGYVTEDHRIQTLRDAAEKWRQSPTGFARACPTCEGVRRETRGLVCQTCGHDYGANQP